MHLRKTIAALCAALLLSAFCACAEKQAGEQETSASAATGRYMIRWRLSAIVPTVF